MKNPNINLTGTPPKMIPSLVKGFNTIANNVYIIVIPIVIDLLLWFGPKLHLKKLILPTLTDLTEQMLKVTPAELSETLKTTQNLWQQMLEQFNLAVFLRTFPVGVPSIIARLSPTSSPLGPDWVYEIPSVSWVFAFIGAALLLGFLLGSIYFYLISRVTATEVEKFSFTQLFKNYGQSLVLFCLFLAVIIFITIPIFMVTSLLSLINMGIGQFFILLAIFGMVWLVMPLIFAPHGVFVLKQKAFPSMMISIRLVRFFLPGTGLFVMTSILISELLNKLWTMPEATSWLTLVGIGGHAFIVTGLMAASFVYYREGLRWMQDNLQKAANAAIQQKPENGGTTLEQ